MFGRAGDGREKAEAERAAKRPALPSGRGGLRWLRRALPMASGLQSTRYLTRWLLLSSAIGVVAGIGAIAFYLAIEWATKLFLGQIVGYLPPSPAGEGSTGIVPMVRPWLLPLVTALGGLISGLILLNLAPEAEGHGMDAAIDAIHHKRGRIRSRIPLVKLVASTITIGSGGSAGRGGPAAQISAGLGSLLGRWLKLGVREQQILVTAGMGAGIGAVFRAPLGGAVLAAQVLYRHDLEVEALIPSLIASIVSYAVYRAWFGFTPIFGSQPFLALQSPVQLLYYAALGVACGSVGILYARSFHGVADLFQRVRLPEWLKPAIGGAMVGGMGVLLPGVLHMGFGWLQIGMGQELLDLPLWVVLLLPFAKILATALSIGSGGSGGIIGPGLVIGGMLGASFWRLGYGLLPQMPPDPAPFVIVAMMALFGGIAHAPLAVMLMVAEMTGNLSLLAPAMVAVTIATALVGDNTIYRSQLPDRASTPAHRMRFSFPLLSTLVVRDAMVRPEAAAQADAPLSVAEQLLAAGHGHGTVVVEANGEYLGTVSRAEVERVPAAQRATTPVRAVLANGLQPLEPEQTLDAALEQMAEQDVNWAPVVERGRIVGSLHVRDVVETFRSSITRSARRADVLPRGTVIIEVRLGAASPLVGRTLRGIGLPGETLVVSVDREGEIIFPHANLQLEAGDVVMILGDRSCEAALRSYFEGSAA